MTEKTYNTISKTALTIGLTSITTLMILIYSVEELHVYYLIGFAVAIFTCGEISMYTDKKYRKLRRERKNKEWLNLKENDTINN